MDATFSSTYYKLLCTASDGNSDRIRELLQQGEFPGATGGPCGCTALHAAAEAGELWVIPILIAAGFDPDARTTDGRTPLILAVGRRDMAMVAELVEGGASIQAADSNGDTPLHVAAAIGCASMIEMLLAAGASIQAANKQGNTPFHMTCAGDHSTPLPWRAVTTPWSSVCNPCPGAADRVKAACVLLDAGAGVEAQNRKGRTPLLLAARYGHLLLLEELLSRGAQATALDKRDRAPLHLASWYKHPGVVSRLLQLSQVSQQLEMVWSNGQTALVLACRAGADQVVPLLLAAGADVNALTPCGLRPLHGAVTKNGSLVLAQLLAAGADPYALDQHGQTALLLAASRGHVDIVLQLLVVLAAGQRSGSVDAMKRGKTALHLAVDKGHTSCVKALLSAGADPNKPMGAEAVDSKGVSIAGATPLMWAVAASHADAIPLLANPTSLSQTTWRGQTPLHQALCAGKAHIAQALMAAGSPAGLTDVWGRPAMSLAAGSSKPDIRALLPAMVRGECELHLQQQQQQEGDEGQLERAAVPAAVEDVVFGFLRGWLAASEELGVQRAVPCISMVLDVLGPTAASRLLQHVLDRWTSPSPGATNKCGMQLLRLAHTGWLAAMEQLLNQRQAVTNKLQWLVTQPLQQREGESGAAAAGDQQQASIGQHTSGVCRQLWAEALAAGDAGEWGLLVQRLEQLAGLQPAQCRCALYVVATQKGWVRPPAVMGLCEALLGAWAAGRQQVIRRAMQEVADGVVSAVQAWEQQRALGSAQRRRRFV